MSAFGINAREGTVSSILNSVSNTGKAVKNTTIQTYRNVSELIPPETGSYFLRVLFYLFMYLFMLFLISVLIHFTIRPIFSFYPGGPGFISVPANSYDIVYWNNKLQPSFSSIVPIKGDILSGHNFINNFSFSIDILIRNITDTDSTNRLILYKTNQPGIPLAPPPSTSTSLDDFIVYMSKNSSMMMYLTNTNDLTVTFFSGVEAVNYSCPYIKNVPLFTPFRISVVVEDRLFSLYLNGKQSFQRVAPSTILANSSVPGLADKQAFYSSPGWANTPSQTVFLQNFHLWTRAITYPEVANATPALALTTDFDIPTALPGSSRC